jgi:hypothetical protein
VGAGAAWFGLYVSSGKSSVTVESKKQVLNEDNVG